LFFSRRHPLAAFESHRHIVNRAETFAMPDTLMKSPLRFAPNPSRSADWPARNGSPAASHTASTSSGELRNFQQHHFAGGQRAGL